MGGWGGSSYTTALTVSNNSVVYEHSINGTVRAYYSTVTRNNITGGGPFTDWVGRPEDSSSALQIYGNSSVSSNVIVGKAGYGLLIQRGYAIVSGNIIRNSLRVAGDALIEGNWVTGGIQVGRIYVSAFNEIDYGSGNSVISGNIISGGIFSTYAGGSTTIRGNLIANTSTGISCVSTVNAIQRNTIANTNTAIILSNAISPLNYNNFLNYTQNSLTLSGNFNVDATNNYWGSTDVNAVNLTIHDLKYDPNLGKVSILPMLDALSDQAPPITFKLQLPPEPSEPTVTPMPTITPIETPTANPTQSASSTPNGTPVTSITPGPSIPELPEWLTIAIILIVTGLMLALVAAKRQVRKQN